MDMISYVMGQKSAGAGGGSSDFSTAEVTVVNNTEDSLDILGLPIVIDDEQMPFCCGVVFDQLGSSISDNYVSPLYKGTCLWVYGLFGKYDDYTFTVSGDAEVDDDYGIIKITGNCTITIS